MAWGLEDHDGDGVFNDGGDDVVSGGSDDVVSGGGAMRDSRTATT
jgi:hypothetical protein